MGTSSRRKIPRLKDTLDNVKFDENNNIDLNDFKKIIKDLLFPHGRKSIHFNNIVNSVSSIGFVESISKLIIFSNNYKTLGLTGLGIPNLEKYSYSEQIDLISDNIVESENPELKQSIKDILYLYGIDGALENTFVLVVNVFKKYIERKIQGDLVEEFAERNSDFVDENFYTLLENVMDLAVNKIITISSVEMLSINYENDDFISNWTGSIVNSILEEVVI